jgi:flagellar secretion chaperone FliS
MNNAATAYGAYRQAEIQTTSQRDLIIQLYQGAERFLVQAHTAMTNKKFDISHVSCQKAKAIFVELLSTLNFEKGGEIAKQLHALYAFFIVRIAEANLRQKPEMLSEIVPIIATLREGWQQVPNEFANVSSVPQANQGHAFNITT